MLTVVVCADSSGVFADSSGVFADSSGVFADSKGMCTNGSGVCMLMWWHVLTAMVQTDRWCVLTEGVLCLRVCDDSEGLC